MSRTYDSLDALIVSVEKHIGLPEVKVPRDQYTQDVWERYWNHKLGAWEAEELLEAYAIETAYPKE